MKSHVPNPPSAGLLRRFSSGDSPSTWRSFELAPALIASRKLSPDVGVRASSGRSVGLRSVAPCLMESRRLTFEGCGTRGLRS
jgi:hypothetical protein